MHAKSAVGTRCRWIIVEGGKSTGGWSRKETGMEASKKDAVVVNLGEDTEEKDSCSLCIFIF